MIKHYVMFSLKEEALGKTRSENAILIRQKLEDMKSKIPVIRKMEIGINHPEAPGSNYDLILFIEFDTLADLYHYQQHPAHLEVIEFIRKVRKDKATVDFLARNGEAGD
jgi:hypothetical protein